jgi:hypothetical protein
MADAQVAQDKTLVAQLVSPIQEEEDDEFHDVYDFDANFRIRRQERIKGFIERIRASYSGLTHKGNEHLNSEAFIKSGIIPEFNIDLSTLTRLFQPMRRLHPRVQKKRPVSKPHEGLTWLNVEVSRARNVPQRRFLTGRIGAGNLPGSPGRGRIPGTGRRGGGSRSPSPRRNRDDDENGNEENESGQRRRRGYDFDDEDADMSMTNSFIEASFQGTILETPSEEGSNVERYLGFKSTSSSNRILSPGAGVHSKSSGDFPFRPENAASTQGWAPDALLQVGDNLRISMFDRMADDEKRFLGWIEIPFTTVYLAPSCRIDGWFELNKPPVNLAYVSKEVEVDDGSNASATGSNYLQAQADAATMLYLRVQIDPPLAKPNRAPGGTHSTEKKHHFELARSFEVALIRRWERRFQVRHVQALVNTLSGDNVLVSRYISPCKLPPDYTGNEIETIEEAVRFVSLIPFLDDFSLFTSNRMEVWCTSHEFLSLGAGDFEEHAVLLCNMFLTLDSGTNFESFLVLGHAMPEGRTVYVMRRPKGAVRENITFWNAFTGKGYSASDRTIPLRGIGTIVGPSNIWANVQDYAQPFRMNFDLLNTKSWKPLFDPRKALPTMDPVQTEIEYPMPTQSSIEEAEMQIAETLKSEIKDWRAEQKQMTWMNQAMSRDLQETLTSFENEKLGREEFSEIEHLDTLKKWASTYDMHGFPLNFSFTDIKSICAAIKESGVHHNDNRSVKFAVACKCFGYACNIVSVWVYVVSLVRKT